jgi:hypothetical protein
VFEDAEKDPGIPLCNYFSTINLKGRFANLWLAAASPDSPLPAESRQQEGGSRDQRVEVKIDKVMKKLFIKILLKRLNSLGGGDGRGKGE